MASQIDPTNPRAGIGQATTASVRANFEHAKEEIEALQGTRSIDTGGTGATTAAAARTNLGAAANASPALTGTPTSTTPDAADNSTRIATTAFVKAQPTGSGTVPAGGEMGQVLTRHGAGANQWSWRWRTPDFVTFKIEELNITLTTTPQRMPHLGRQYESSYSRHLIFPNDGNGWPRNLQYLDFSESHPFDLPSSVDVFTFFIAETQAGVAYLTDGWSQWYEMSWQTNQMMDGPAYWRVTSGTRSMSIRIVRQWLIGPRRWATASQNLGS